MGDFSTNTWLVPFAEHEMLVIDPADSAEKIIKFLQQNEITKIKIILTHGHFDHLVAVPDLYEAFPQSPVLIHKNDAHFLGKDALKYHRRLFSYMGAGFLIDSYKKSLPEPTALLKDGDTIGDWLVIHTPGHSEGSICLYNEKEKALIAGDTLFYCSIGRTDLWGSNPQDMHNSLIKLMRLPPEVKVYPGHGPTTTIANERRFH